MAVLLEYGPWLLPMALLLILSAFCSASEASFFYLSRPDRRQLAAGNAAQRIAAALLATPDKLLTAILFWNLTANLSYFTLDSILSLNLQKQGRTAEAAIVAVAALVMLILFGELLPKSVAVIRPMFAAALLAIPLRTLFRLIEPLVRLFDWANLLSRRLFWPNFQPEPYLHSSDLERAVRLSIGNTALVAQEQQALESLVALSEVRADEMMRPRLQLQILRPPIGLAALEGRLPPGGWLLVADPTTDEPVSAIQLLSMSQLPEGNWERLAEPLAYVPWCTSAAEVLETLRQKGRRAAAVVNEYGETIGLLPADDIVASLFSRAPSRSERLLARVPVRQVAPGTWQVTGITSVRRLARFLERELPPTQSVTVGGVVQELLGRLPQRGDQCRWGPYDLRVLDVPARGRVLVEIRQATAEEEV